MHYHLPTGMSRRRLGGACSSNNAAVAGSSTGRPRRFSRGEDIPQAQASPLNVAGPSGLHYAQVNSLVVPAARDSRRTIPSPHTPAPRRHPQNFDIFSSAVPQTPSPARRSRSPNSIDGEELGEDENEVPPSYGAYLLSPRVHEHPTIGMVIERTPSPTSSTPPPPFPPAPPVSSLVPAHRRSNRQRRPSQRFETPAPAGRRSTPKSTRTSTSGKGKKTFMKKATAKWHDAVHELKEAAVRPVKALKVEIKAKKAKRVVEKKKAKDFKTKLERIDAMERDQDEEEALEDQAYSTRLSRRLPRTPHTNLIQAPDFGLHANNIPNLPVVSSTQLGDWMVILGVDPHDRQIVRQVFDIAFSLNSPSVPASRLAAASMWLVVKKYGAVKCKRIIDTVCPEVSGSKLSALAKKIGKQLPPELYDDVVTVS